jgi:hypothetical protein
LCLFLIFLYYKYPMNSVQRAFFSEFRIFKSGITELKIIHESQ